MEDRGTKTGPINKETTPVNTKGRITLMIMGRVGRMRSFNISLGILFWTAIFFLIYILASIIIINSYFNLRHERTVLVKRINQLKRDHVETKKSLFRSKQHRALLVFYIDGLEGGHKQDYTPPQEKNLADHNDKEKKSRNVVDIQDMVIKKDDSTMNIDLKVVNIQKGEGAVRGYIHIIAKNNPSNSQQKLTYPKEKLKNGVPLNFRQGELFVIERFKPIHGKFDLSPGYKPASNIMVLVYDRSGTLILKKSFEVRDASKIHVG
ncbi:MAG: hypothetical protein SV375_00800 [Thermodesulfobacteriota bacterium]|nr:hypothetical protein [Thermodesulfobacteriota bacterium]